MNLFDELIASLLLSGRAFTVLSCTETEEISNVLFDKFPLNWGRINWAEIQHKEVVKDLRTFLVGNVNIVDSLDEQVYVVWGDASLRSIKCSLWDILHNVERVKFLGGSAVWLLDKSGKWVIEIYHDDEITFAING